MSHWGPFKIIKKDVGGRAGPEELKQDYSALVGPRVRGHESLLTSLADNY